MGFRLEDIDPDIRDIIILLNRLPFLKTVNSCSGHPDIIHKSNSLPYVDIQYEPAMINEATQFHGELVAAIPNLRFTFIERGKMSLGRLGVSYDGRMSYQMKAIRPELTKENLKKFWDAWRMVVSKYIK